MSSTVSSITSAPLASPLAQPLQYFIIDAFAERPFSGNPAAVVLLPLAGGEDTAAVEAAMRSLAAEFNLSETAFVSPSPPGGGLEAFRAAPRFGLRWLTPTREVALCGHATLAAAHALLAAVSYTHLTLPTNREV